MDKVRNRVFSVFFAILLLVGLYISQNSFILQLSYILMCVVMLARCLYSAATLRRRLLCAVHYIVIAVFELMFTSQVTFNPDRAGAFHALLAVSVLMLPVPVMVELYFSHPKGRQVFMPSIEDFKAVTYAQFIYDVDKIKNAFLAAKQAGKALSKDNVATLLEQFHRQSSFRYTNNHSLTEEYFEQAHKFLEDEYIYLTLTDSGSPASELISVFTRKKFNHVSLSFDADLQTIISYNGGENVYPPGLNPEMIAWFYKKKDSAVLIYRLRTTREQKLKIIEKIREINRDGSAYNLVGLIFKYSYKPNIMFCSQFVYHILRHAGLDDYLGMMNLKATDIRPTDFVEMDYRRRLEFVREITFG